MGPGTGGAKVGVSPAGPGPQTVPAALQPRLSRRAGFLGNNFVFPETPIGERLGETTLLCCSFTGAQMLRPSFAEVLSPAPFGLGMAARPSVAGPALRRARWGRRQISKTGASGEGGGRSTDCASLWRGSELEALRLESRVHPPNPPPPPPTPRPSCGPGCKKEQPSFYCNNH